VVLPLQENVSTPLTPSSMYHWNSFSRHFHMYWVNIQLRNEKSLGFPKFYRNVQTGTVLKDWIMYSVCWYHSLLFLYCKLLSINRASAFVNKWFQTTILILNSRLCYEHDNLNKHLEATWSSWKRWGPRHQVFQLGAAVANTGPIVTTLITIGVY